MKLTREAFHETPARDTAVSAALLAQVSDGLEPETLRLYRPRRLVLFGPRDARRPGFEKAIALAKDAGFDPIERLGGGQPAVFHEETIGFALAIPIETAHEGIKERFQLGAELFRDGLARLGLDARIGEVPGEYCPGEFSVNVGGTKKVVGIGQRIIGHGAHIGGVVVVGGADLINETLVPIYEALELEMDPAITGDLPGHTYDEVDAAITAAFAARYPIDESPLLPETVARAARFEPKHVLPQP